ncbi:hypothetical protein ACEN9R_04845, partial [Curtobacterium sp. CT11-133]
SRWPTCPQVHTASPKPGTWPISPAAVFETAGWGLARAALLTAGILDVTTIVIGGGIARSWDLLEPAISAAIALEPPVSGAPIRLALSSLGSDAVALGAAAQVRDLVLGSAPAR